jgi:hypothetical protein
MENDIASGDPNESRAAADILGELQADRARLAQRTQAPRWLAPGFGVIAGLYVLIPALPGDRPGTGFVTTALVVGIVMVYASRRITGIKFARFGAQAWFALAGAVIGTLALFSVALGLVSLDLHWWVVAPAAAAFGLVMWLTGVIFSSMRKNLDRDR